MTDLLLRDATIVDGTGSPARRGDVAVRAGLIEAVGDLGGIEAAHVVDLGELVVAPGFIDVHAHSDLAVLGHPAATSKVLQGVTTEVVGNCGLAVAPISSPDVVDLVRPLMTYCEDPRVSWDWTSVAGYRQRLRDAGPLVDVQILAGHNTIRASVLALDDRAATAEEIARMCAMLDTALAEGAIGMSVGLMYPPSSYAAEEELVALGRVIAARGAVFASHMRDYSSGLLAAVEEMIGIAERSGCRMQLSHLAVAGRENWGMVSRALELIDAATARGVDVAVDFYPYLAGSTNLSQFVPLWSLEGGLERFRSRLDDADDRARILRHLRLRTLGWDEVLLVSVESDPSLDGTTIADAADRAGLDPEELVLALLARCDPTIVAFGRSEDDLRAVVAHPGSILGSDGIAIDTWGTVGGPVPHPRFFGAFPALFESYVREARLLTLEEAVRKCTSASAARLGLDDRGRIEPGLRADLVVFDPATIADRSRYTDSRQVPDGIESVYREGVRIAHRGRVELERFPG